MSMSPITIFYKFYILQFSQYGQVKGGGLPTLRKIIGDPTVVSTILSNIKRRAFLLWSLLTQAGLSFRDVIVVQKS